MLPFYHLVYVHHVRPRWRSLPAEELVGVARLSPMVQRLVGPAITRQRESTMTQRVVLEAEDTRTSETIVSLGARIFLHDRAVNTPTSSALPS